MNIEQREALVRRLWPAGGAGTASVWGVLDCARDSRIYGALLESRLEFLCLYSGRLPRELEVNAPHIVELLPGNRFAQRWLDEGWGQAWGSVLRIDDPSNLRHHLRKLLRVRVHDGRRLLFRYYDPRVLRTYLPTCNAAERRQFFGPISHWLTETEDGTGVVEHARGVPSAGARQEPADAAVSADASALQIRREQWQAFARQAAQRHAVWLAAELARLFPQAAQGLGDADWLERVGSGMGRAQALGLASRGDLLRYLSLECEYGAGFSERPAFAWMRAMLVDRRVPQPAQRMQRLMRAIAARAARADQKAAVLAEYLSTQVEEEA